MATERLIILAAAVALQEFTAPELAAHTGSSPGTVRQVLRREQERYDLFERSRSANTILWRLKNPGHVLDELAREEAQATGLRSVGMAWAYQDSSVVQLRRMQTLLASAEDAAAHSYEVEDVTEQKALAQIAINLLNAADPMPVDEPADDLGKISATPPRWWEQSPESDQLDPNDIAPDADHYLDATGIAELTARLVGADRKAIYQQAGRVAAFAYLAVRHSSGLPVGAKHLMPVAEAIASGSKTLPPHVTESWVRRIVGLTTAGSENPPPIAVLTQPERPPDELFPVERGTWRKVRMPKAIAPTRYVLWVEDWAEPLFAARLMPGLVISHEDTPEANDVLSRILSEGESALNAQAKIVVSTADHLDGVARQVSIGGGTLYPIRETREGLLKAVSRAVTQAVRITYHRGSDPLPGDIIETYGRLESMAGLDLDSDHHPLFPNARFLSLLAHVASFCSPEQAGAATDQCARIYRDIIEANHPDLLVGVAYLASAGESTVGTAPGHGRDANAAAEPAGAPNSQVVDSEALTEGEKNIARLAAHGLSNRAIADCLFASPASISGVVSGIVAKLGLASRADIAAWEGKGKF